jgi:hypothetical protein
MLFGAGRSIRDPLIILITGCEVRIDLNIVREGTKRAFIMN